MLERSFMIYVILFAISFIFTYGIKNYAIKKSLLDIPNERSSHSVPTPHGGGIAIAVCWFFGLIYLFTCKGLDAPLFYALMAGIMLSLVSYMDDLYELSPKIRLMVQASVGAFGLFLLGGLSKIDFGFFAIENHIITNIVAFFGIMWCINLYNFLDGIDGYAGSEAVFLGSAGWLMFGGDYFLVLIASVGGFLVWNWHRAKIFMGDVGSTLLGYTVAIFAIYHQNHEVSIFVWLILFGLFWFDATLTLYRRYKKGEKLSQAHRKHVYQRLTQSGWSHSKVVVVSLFLNVILAIIGYIAFHFKAVVLICFIAAIALLYGVVRYVDTRKKFV